MRFIKILRRTAALLLSAVLIAVFLPAAVIADGFPARLGNTDNNIFIQSAAADNAQTNIPDSAAEIEDGAVLADKFVEYIEYEENGAFEITLSAIGRRTDMTKEEYIARYKPMNVVFVLDTSGSMSDIDLDVMTAAVKESGKMILEANENNNAAIVYFDQSARLADNGWTWVNQSNTAATLDTLTRPSKVNWTNISAGLNLAAYLLNSADAPNRDTASRVIVLMSDGAPNRYSSGDADWGAGIQGSSSATGDAGSVRETIKRAAAISHSGIDIYTVGYNISNNNLAWIALNPNNGPNRIYSNVAAMDVTASWRDNNTTLRFRAGGANPNVDITNALINGMTTEQAEIYYKYNRAYYAPLNPADLIESFRDFVNEITVTADAASPVGTEVVITDTIGEGFELAESVETIQARAAGNGTQVYYDYDGRTLTWVIPAAALNLIDPKGWSGNVTDVTAGNADRPVNHTINPNTLTFKVKLTDGAEPAGDEPQEFFTDEKAEWIFDKSDENIFAGETGGELVNTGKIIIVKEIKETESEEPGEISETTNPQSVPSTQSPTPPPIITTVPREPVPAPVTVTKPDEPVIVEPIIPEDFEDVLIPLTDGYFAIPIQGEEVEGGDEDEDFYEIFDESGVPLGVIQVPENEDIEEYFGLDDIIPIDDFILSVSPTPTPTPTEESLTEITEFTEFTETEEDIIAEEEVKDNPETGNAVGFLILPAVLLLAAAVILKKRKI